MKNYIPDLNPLDLAGPPTYFLQRLWDFDPSLVVIPSRQGYYYRLAQRRPLDLRENIVNDILFKDSDTEMLSRYSLVPVTTILSTAKWDSPLLFKALEERAPWRQGGHEKVNKRIESYELEEARKTRQATDEHLTSLSKDGWKLYRKKIGLGSTKFLSPSTGWGKTHNESTQKAPMRSGGVPFLANEKGSGSQRPSSIILTDQHRINT